MDMTLNGLSADERKVCYHLFDRIVDLMTLSRKLGTQAIYLNSYGGVNRFDEPLLRLFAQLMKAHIYDIAIIREILTNYESDSGSADFNRAKKALVIKGIELMLDINQSMDEAVPQLVPLLSGYEDEAKEYMLLTDCDWSELYAWTGRYKRFPTLKYTICIAEYDKESGGFMVRSKTHCKDDRFRSEMSLCGYLLAKYHQIMYVISNLRPMSEFTFYELFWKEDGYMDAVYDRLVFVKTISELNFPDEIDFFGLRVPIIYDGAEETEVDYTGQPPIDYGDDIQRMDGEGYTWE